MPTEHAAEALRNLRDPSMFNWSVIPILVLVFYIYSVEIERRNWNVLFAGLAFWGMDWFNEIWNGLVFHFTNYAPMWAAPGDSAFIILIGLNIEISMMFAYMGVMAAKSLPADKHMRILGVPNRLAIACLFSAACVIVEIFLNAADALTWDWWFWSARSPLPIFLFGYLHFFLVAFWVHDMEKVASKVRVVSAIYAFDIACLVVFGGMLGWI
ncbi:MAG: hypothetical protein D6760_09830 [Deltaproteobacteria bacterium]|nr:MAG: hypothetical protein D6760_09830 [Deltaproteobacteria bacterium]